MPHEEINVPYVARLARILLTPEEEKEMASQLEKVLGYIEKLKEVDVTGVEPTAHPFPLVNVFRKDETWTSLEHSEAMRNAPGQGNGLFTVPKIIE